MFIKLTRMNNGKTFDTVINTDQIIEMHSFKSDENTFTRIHLTRIDDKGRTESIFVTEDFEDLAKRLL